MNLTELKQKPVTELADLAENLGIDNVSQARKQEVVANILRKTAVNGEEIIGDGTLEVLQDGFGFLRSPYSSYLAGPDDIYVSHSQIRRFRLRTGDSIAGKIRPPKDNERYFALVHVNEINKTQPDIRRNTRQMLFDNFTADFPNERYTLERGNGSSEDVAGRIVDLIAPIGKGQRALVVSPPKAGKTIMLQAIAQSITANNPEGDINRAID